LNIINYKNGEYKLILSGEEVTITVEFEINDDKEISYKELEININVF